VKRAFLAVALMLAGCAAPSSYMGISLRPGAAEPALQSLAARAATGDKRAQLELGVRYEEGQGIPRDLHCAAALYLDAAIDGTRHVTIYQPRVGHVAAQSLQLADARTEPGLEVAKMRLAAVIVKLRNEQHR
jgi:TPR repeat protein